MSEGPTIDTALRLMSPVLRQVAEEIDRLHAEVKKLQAELGEARVAVQWAKAEAYRRGVEDAAKVAERVESVPAEVGPAGATYSGYDLQAVFPREGSRIAAAIRALPADKEAPDAS